MVALDVLRAIRVSFRAAQELILWAITGIHETMLVVLGLPPLNQYDFINKPTDSFRPFCKPCFISTEALGMKYLAYSSEWST